MLLIPRNIVKRFFIIVTLAAKTLGKLGVAHGLQGQSQIVQHYPANTSPDDAPHFPQGMDH
jgi:hypothetical protein